MTQQRLFPPTPRLRVRAVSWLSPEQRMRNVARLRAIVAAIEATPDWRGRRAPKETGK